MVIACAGDSVTPEQYEEIQRLLLLMSAEGEYAGNFSAEAEDGERLCYYFLRQEDGAALLGMLKTIQFEEEAVVAYAYVHPDYRRRGYFKRLLAAARKELAPPEPAFEFPVYTESGTACAKHMRMREGNTEYHLVLTLPAALGRESGTETRIELVDWQDKLDELARIHSAAFAYPPELSTLYFRDCCGGLGAKSLLIYDTAAGAGETVGCGLLLDNTERRELWLCGFCVLPQRRRRGTALRALRQLAAWASGSEQGYHTISVQVSGENSAAYALYRRAGFTEKASFTSYFTGRRER